MSDRKSEGGDDDTPQYQFEYIDWTTPLPDGFLPPPATDPFTWTPFQKNVALTVCCMSTLVAAAGAGAYTSGIPQMSEQWNIGRVPLMTGVSAFTGGFAIAPMALAPVSETYGRLPVFIVSHILYIITHLAMALCNNFPGMIMIRIFSGIASSTFSSISGGLISDIYHTQDRGFPMAVFSAIAVFGTGLGPLIGGLIVGSDLSWRWIHWVQLILCGVFLIPVFLTLKETRGSVLLSRRAKALNAFLNDHPDISNTRYKAHVDSARESLSILIRTSLTRPFLMLCTEPVVFLFSLWTAFAWGLLYLFLQGIPIVFTLYHSFTPLQLAAVFTAMCAGTIPAFILTTILDRHVPSRIRDSPDSRLFAASTLGLLLPAGIFMFFYTANLAPAIPGAAVGLVTIGVFTIYLAVFNYFCDCYHRYSSSALAAQSFCRNVLAAVFPPAVDGMYKALGKEGMGALLGGVAAGLGVVPWLLILWGKRIRERSAWVGKTEE
ncbi:putative MFS transporter [Ascodesmis nigricans]|uniref:Putative MFS transporter n=1 Tax=Ascodesmis nigricans TaxID=341454 RepID=A0A4S2N6N1_9PEZI|nr:putative MFS transporter [Ascodesmis nigricans]